MTESHPITVAYGDGIGPEILEATLPILREAGAKLSIDTIEIGKRIYAMGGSTGILPSAFHKLEQSRILLKGPTFPPESTGAEDIRQMICKRFELESDKSTILSCDSTPSVSSASYIGESFALFEPRHSVEEVALKSKHKANPTAMILASIQMLEHIGQTDVAERISKALHSTLQDGIHTRDLYKRGESKKKVSTSQFADQVMARLYKNT